MSFTDSLSFVWPLTFLLVSLFVLRRIEEDLRPVFRNVVTGVAANAQSNALRYAMAMMLASLSAMQALGDVARELGWVYIEAFAKVAQPALAAIVGYIIKSDSPTSSPTPPAKTP
jgi:hypothetical protein